MQLGMKKVQLLNLEELKFGTVELSGYELAKSITVSWKLKTMAINELETYIM